MKWSQKLLNYIQYNKNIWTVNRTEEKDQIVLHKQSRKERFLSLSCPHQSQNACTSAQHQNTKDNEYLFIIMKMQLQSRDLSVNQPWLGAATHVCNLGIVISRQSSLWSLPVLEWRKKDKHKSVIKNLALNIKHAHIQTMAINHWKSPSLPLSHFIKWLIFHISI